MPNGWSKQSYLQGFNFYLHFKKSVNVFERIYYSESIYKGAVLPSKIQMDGHMQTVLVLKGKILQNPPRIQTILIIVIALVSAKQEMYTTKMLS